jgi:predicted Zn finger-like uncharacterized protein
MPVNIHCPGCNAAMKVREDLAGKKVKCPRCSEVFEVQAGEEEFAPVEEVPEDAIRTTPGRGGKSRSDRAYEEVEDEDDRPRKRDRGRRREERSKYEPCPRCEAVGAKRVLWTFWGSFYGPALFTHVRCPECSHCYNGKTGGSNLVPAILFFTVPLLGILGIFGGLIVLYIKLGYL